MYSMIIRSLRQRKEQIASCIPEAADLTNSGIKPEAKSKDMQVVQALLNGRMVSSKLAMRSLR